MTPYRRIGLTVKPNLTSKDEAVRQVVDILHAAGTDIFIDALALEDVSCTRAFEHLSSDTPVDLLVVIGGDGTILRAVREFLPLHAPILGINRGVLGFLAEVSVNEAAVVLPQLLSGEGFLEERRALDVRVIRGMKEVFSGTALNEAAISQGAIARLLDLRTDISGEPLATFHADGLIVATPTGSTAYSLAAGGPVVHPSIAAMILTPINPHSLTQKPVVIPGERAVNIDVIKPDNPFGNSQPSLTLDGQVYFELQNDDRVITVMDSQPVRFLRRHHERFFHALRTKLRWGERI